MAGMPAPVSYTHLDVYKRQLSHMARKYGLPVVIVGQAGGDDDLIFDGHSAAFDAEGRMFARAHGFSEDVTVVDLAKSTGRIAPADFEPESEVWSALVLGVRDYARKTHFRQVLLGLSGGIDSALTAAIAVDALGAENVLGVLMPSKYSSQGSVDDSLELARNLGIRTVNLPIPEIMATYERVLADVFCGREPDVTEENIQSRIRGSLLMAISNKFGSLLLTTGNKSEIAVGYCTLYGDMNGGLAVIADLPKMMVYRVSRWRNRRKADIPEAILTKAPSAELRPGQTDQDSLPPYELLDQILELHVEQSKSAEEIVARGFDEATVRRVVKLVRNAEFKRKQAAPGLKVTSRAFGTGWRMPVSYTHLDVYKRQVHADHLLVARDDARFPNSFERRVALHAGGIDAGFRQQPEQELAGGVFSGEPHDRDMRGEFLQITRHIGGAAGVIRFARYVDDGNRRFRRNARHIAPDEFIQHEVADHQNPASGEGRC